MKLRFVEALSAGGNFGRFVIGRHTPEERLHRSAVEPGKTIFRSAGRWNDRDVWVMDLVTGEGARFDPTGYAKADLDRHRIWVCPLFEPFLSWLYEQDLSDLEALPEVVTLDAPLQFQGYRRPGPDADG